VIRVLESAFVVFIYVLECVELEIVDDTVSVERLSEDVHARSNRPLLNDVGELRERTGIGCKRCLA
jgi:hypothetical protein